MRRCKILSIKILNEINLNVTNLPGLFFDNKDFPKWK